MEISQAGIAALYLYAWLLGLALGIFYELLSVTRILLGERRSEKTLRKLATIQLPKIGRIAPPKRRSVLLGGLLIFEDFLFSLLCAVAMILLYYEANNGKIRPLAIPIAAAGFLLERILLGRILAIAATYVGFALRVAEGYAIFVFGKPIRFAWGKAKTVYLARLDERTYQKLEIRAKEDALGLIPIAGKKRKRSTRWKRKGKGKSNTA